MSERLAAVLVEKCYADAIVPEFQTEGASGADLHAYDEKLKDGNLLALLPGDTVIVGTGVKVGVPSGYEGQVRPRSGLAAKFGITVVNAPGTIDNDYRGEIKVILHRLRRSISEDKDQDHFFVKQGDRIAQLVICPVTRPTFEVVKSLDETERGEGDFGSTGVDRAQTRKPKEHVPSEIVPALCWVYRGLTPHQRESLFHIKDGEPGIPVNHVLNEVATLQGQSEWDTPHGYSSPQPVTLEQAFDLLYPEKEEGA